jgi:hypothetical protein
MPRIGPPDAAELPLNERPDMSPYIVHLTKNTKAEDEYSAFDNLVNILRLGRILGSTKEKGFIKGPHKAACFMDVPFAALKYVLNPRDTNPENPRYEPYGVFITKKVAYDNGCRPVLYLSNAELQTLDIPADERWRVVRFEISKEGWISWIHEREWRCEGAFHLPESFSGVLVKSPYEARKLTKMLSDEKDEFKARPSCIIPLSVICQGFITS